MATKLEGNAREKSKDRVPIAYKPIALDGGYGWVVVLGSFLIHVFADGFVYSFGVIAESLIREFDATNAEVSTVLSLLTGLMLAAGPLASAVCNRIGCRITTIIGAIIASIGCAISYNATSMTYLILSVGIVMGTGFGFMYCPAIVIVTMYFERYRSLATGVTVCGAGVGTFAFSKIIGFLIMSFDWRTVFLIYAGLVLLCVPCGMLYRPIEFAPIYAEDDQEEADSRQNGSKKNGNLVNESAGHTELTFADDEASYLLDDKNVPQNGTQRKHVTSITNAIPEEEDTHSGNDEGDVSHYEGRPDKTFERFDRSATKHSDNAIRSSISQVITSDAEFKHSPINNGVLQRFRSLGEHLHLRSSGHTHLQASNTRNGNILSPQSRAHNGERNTICISTGYLNIKDVFYNRSVTALPEYVENQQRFRSILSLHDTGHTTNKTMSGSLRPRSDTCGSKIHRHINNDAALLKPNGDATYTNEKIEKHDEGVVFFDERNMGKITKNALEKSDSISVISSSKRIEIWRTIKRLMDLSLLIDPIYLLFAISNFLTSIGFNAPPMFMPLNAEMVLGFSKTDAASTVSAYGLANLFGRIAFGLLCDRQLPFRWGRDCARNRLWIYNLMLMLCGFATCFVFTIQSFPLYVSYSFFFGFTISSYVCLTSVVLVDLVGVDRLTNAFGLLLFIQGIATFVGPPIAGQLFDLTKKYDWTFAFCGICLFISGIMMFAIPTIRRRQNNGKTNLMRNGSEVLQLTMPSYGSAENTRGQTLA